MAERWLINELFKSLLDFGNQVFSPFHHAGLLPAQYSYEAAKSIASTDLEELKKSDVLLAVVSGMDAGTLFEVGYARSLGIPVIVLTENVSENDLTMFIGTDCIITNDFSTAVYKSSW